MAEKSKLASVLIFVFKNYLFVLLTVLLSLLTVGIIFPIMWLRILLILFAPFVLTQLTSYICGKQLNKLHNEPDIEDDHFDTGDAEIAYAISASPVSK